MASLPSGLIIGYSYKNDGSDLSLTSLFMSERTYKVGEGLGEGVERSVLAQAVQKLTSELSTWVETMDRFKSFSTLPFGVLDPKMPAQLVQDMLSARQLKLQWQLYAGVLLGCPSAFTLDVPQEILAFAEGFNVYVSEEIPSLASLTHFKTLHPSLEGLIAELYQQHFISPAQLIQRLEFEVVQISESDGGHARRQPVIDSDMEAAFILRCTQYLRGVGHPKHPAVEASNPKQNFCVHVHNQGSLFIELNFTLRFALRKGFHRNMRIQNYQEWALIGSQPPIQCTFRLVPTE
ncbi:uncharacterized protein HD556DRAFT_1310759 [Suillus plorans]|uniref:Uncharacterized protein n=1 Tax=Suillus plorans TaxID=116603 RepID=A0A9P7AJI2_9AGAM|nr:uncharacterized protein HD556DRAFT_1310759 [Suillus plorans]KAG1790151.1 hypothetical protein HD556DRAFT_1310759 [Suillus plorans]